MYVCVYTVTDRWLMSRMVYAISRHFTHLICAVCMFMYDVEFRLMCIILYMRFIICIHVQCIVYSHTHIYIRRGWKSLYSYCVTLFRFHSPSFSTLWKSTTMIKMNSNIFCTFFCFAFVIIKHDDNDFFSSFLFISSIYR